MSTPYRAVHAHDITLTLGEEAALSTVLTSKLAYGSDEHEAIARHAVGGLGPEVNPDISRRFLRGSTTIDTALRGTHPFFGAVSPDVAAQHAFRLGPGTAGRRIVGKNILERHREAVHGLAQGMAEQRPEMVRQHLHTAGGVNHTMADLSSHFERGFDTAPITQARSPAVGRAIGAVLPGHTAATLEQLIAHTTSNPDIIVGDPLDRLAQRRSAGHGNAIRNQTVNRMVSHHGMPLQQAQDVWARHMRQGVPHGLTGGGVRRALEAVEGAVDPGLLLSKLTKPRELAGHLGDAVKNVGNLARGYGETSPSLRRLGRLFRRG